MHLLTYLAVALAFLHQLAGPDLAGHRVVQIAWTLMYADAFGLVCATGSLRGPWRTPARHRLRVEAVIPEADGVVSIDRPRPTPR